MGKHLGFLAFVSCLSAAAPVMAANSTTEGATATASVAVQHVRAAVPGLRDEAAMVLVGTALIGLAAALRRAPARRIA
jgi:hypothetical protein